MHSDHERRAGQAAKWIALTAALGLVTVSSACAPAAQPEASPQENIVGPATPALVPTSPTPPALPSPTPLSTTPAPAKSTQESSLPPGVSRRIRVTEGGFFISPNSFEVTGGETLLWEITSEDFSHTFNVAEIGLNVSVSGGQTVTQTFTVPDAPGSYKVFCAVSNHRAQGMERAFEVKPETGASGQAVSTPRPQETPYFPSY